MNFAFLRRKPPATAAPDPDLAIEDALAEAKALFQARNYQAALAIWGPMAHRGVARAANNVGACFMGGLGVDADEALGFRWLLVAAEGGDPSGMRNLAAAYFQGKGTAQDSDAAIAWYRKASEANDADAQDMLSWMLLEGEIAEIEPVEARKWAEAAAAAGVASAMTRMGMIHHNALGVARDAKLAAEWWAKGVEAGDPDAMAMLGAANHLGQGVDRDPFRAMVLLIMARAGGSQLADTFYGVVKASLPDGAFAMAQTMAADLRAKTGTKAPAP